MIIPLWNSSNFDLNLTRGPARKAVFNKTYEAGKSSHKISRKWKKELQSPGWGARKMKQGVENRAKRPWLASGFPNCSIEAVGIQPVRTPKNLPDINFACTCDQSFHRAVLPNDEYRRSTIRLHFSSEYAIQNDSGKAAAGR
jgi:hypothetical protein